MCGPVLREAAKLGIPCVIHESNAYPGVTTKMLAKSVKAVMLAVPDAKQYFDSSVNCVVTGNPVRGEVLTAQREESRKAACDAVRKLGQDVGIPADLKAIVKDEDVQFLAESAFADACRPGNPRNTSVEEIAALYRSMM